MSGLGERIKEKRTAAGLTQEELARLIHTTRQTVSNYELGNSEPGLDVLQDLAVELHCSVAELIGEQLREDSEDVCGEAGAEGRAAESMNRLEGSYRKTAKRSIIVLAVLFILEIAIQLAQPWLLAYQGKTYDITLRLIAFYVLQSLIALAAGLFAVRLIYAVLGRPRPKLRAARIASCVFLAAVLVIHLWVLADLLRMHFGTVASQGIPGEYRAETTANILYKLHEAFGFNTFVYRLFWLLAGAAAGIPDTERR